MSFDSIHTQYPIDGLRLTQQITITPQFLRELGWDGLMVWNTQLMGNSKFEDATVIAAFLKCNLNVTATVKMIGYKPHNAIITWVATRVLRHNSKSILDFLRNLMLAGLIPKDHCSKMLHRDRKATSPATNMIAIDIIESAIRKWGSKEKAGAKLRIDMSIIEYWLKKKK